MRRVPERGYAKAKTMGVGGVWGGGGGGGWGGLFLGGGGVVVGGVGDFSNISGLRIFSKGHCLPSNRTPFIANRKDRRGDWNLEWPLGVTCYLKGLLS